MPASRRFKRAREALLEAAARHRRMTTYTQAWYDLLALRGGPHGVSVYLLSKLDPGFQKKVDRLRIRCRRFDQLEARTQRVLRRYEHDYDKHCDPLRHDIIDLELKAARFRAHKRRFNWQFFNQRRWHYAREIRIANKQLRSLRWRHYKAFRHLNLIYRPIVEPAFQALDHYEKTYLTQWVHSFEADLESFRMTVVSGRLLDILMLEQNATFRQNNGFDDLPLKADDIRPFLKAFLTRHNVGYGPRVTIETLLESYLRLKLMTNPQLRANWDVNDIWLRAHLPLPGALGITQERYNHLPPHFNWASGAVSSGQDLPPETPEPKP